MRQWDSDYYQLSGIVWPLSVGCRLLAVGFRLTDLRRRGDRASPPSKKLAHHRSRGWGTTEWWKGEAATSCRTKKEGALKK